MASAHAQRIQKALGGKVLSVGTRHLQNRAALALRFVAQTLHHNHSALTHHYRRMALRLGAPKAITAAAHKLARIIYHLLVTGQPYQETVFAEREKQQRLRTITRLKAQVQTLEFRLVPAGATAPGEAESQGKPCEHHKLSC